MKILVIGNRGEGKTSLALALYKTLKIYGFNVEYISHNDNSTKLLKSIANRDLNIRHIINTPIEILDNYDKETG